jgi:hypothetical protein
MTHFFSTVNAKWYKPGGLGGMAGAGGECINSRLIFAEIPD